MVAILCTCCHTSALYILALWPVSFRASHLCIVIRSKCKDQGFSFALCCIFGLSALDDIPLFSQGKY